MDKLSISELSCFSGIKPHTIRAWEQRYDALKPNRSQGNTRYYSGEELRRLLNIVSLLETGGKISELALLPDSKLFSLVRKVRGKSVSAPTKYFVPQLIAAGMEYNEPEFEKILSHCLLRFGTRRAYVEILCPMLQQLGMMWFTNDLPTGNEHFISNIVRQKLFVSIDSLPLSAANSSTWVLYLPEGEFHEVGLLMSNYLLRLSGKKTIYLGANSPLKTVIQTAENINVENILVFFTHNDDSKKIHRYLDGLRIANPNKKLFVAGNIQLFENYVSGKSITYLGSVKDLESICNL